ncbi:hypothetical protein GCM10027605_69070 [Micromonospora zhanjiangensis]
MAEAGPVVIDKPGIYNLPADVYHRDPVPGGSLSSTGARKLLPPSCPALFKHWLDTGDEPKAAWDIGTAAHKLVLGVGPELVRIDADEWRTKAVKEEVAAVRARGAVPLRPADWDTVHAMAAKLREHPVATALFTPRGRPDVGPDGAGQAEVTVVWQDQRTGVWCRALIDYLPYFTLHRDGQPAVAPAYPGRLLLPDYKSGRSAAPDKLGRTIADFGYHVQLAWYLMGLRAVGYARDDAQALLVVQETRPPYLVTVCQPDRDAMLLGALRCRQALDVYAECTASGRWPGYADDVVLAELPPWETRELDGAVW